MLSLLARSGLVRGWSFQNSSRALILHYHQVFAGVSCLTVWSSADLSVGSEGGHPGTDLMHMFIGVITLVLKLLLPWVSVVCMRTQVCRSCSQSNSRSQSEGIFFLCFLPLFNFFHLSFWCLDYFLCGNRLKVFDLPTSQGLGRDDGTGQREGEGRKEGRKGCVVMIELDSRKDQVFCLVSLGNKSYLHLGCSVWSYY